MFLQMPDDYDSNAFDALEHAVLFLKGHREWRAIVTALDGSAHRFRAMTEDHDALISSLRADGDYHQQETALSHFYYDWLSCVDCFTMACHHLAAVAQPTIFGTSTRR